jgi:HTH-type transcriptional regulator / antitoxin HigA
MNASLQNWMPLVDQVGEDESHPLASMMDVLSALIENYENAHVPELCLR